MVAANQQSQIDDYNPTDLTLGQLESVSGIPLGLSLTLSASVGTASADVEGVISLSATLSSQPLSVSNQAVTLAQDSVDQANIFYDTISEVPYELMTQNTQQLAALLYALNTFLPQSDAAQNLAQVGQQFTAQLRQEVQALINQGVVAPTRLGDPNFIQQLYTTVSGDTPASVSARVYDGTPDHAADILIANGLSWYTPTFQSGMVLVIPRLRSTNQTQTV